MKTKATKNFLTSGYKNIICIPAGALQTLLRYRDAAYYCASRNGWKCDIYQFGDAIISTGYQSFGNIIPSGNLIADYEHRAKNIVNNYDIDEECKPNMVNALAQEFVDVCLSA